MKKHTTKMLALRPTTIRTLSGTEMEAVAGGGTTVYTCVPQPQPQTMNHCYPPATTTPPNFSNSCFNC